MSILRKISILSWQQELDEMIEMCRRYNISKISIDTKGVGLAIADYVEEHSSIKVERITSNIYHDDKMIKRNPKCVCYYCLRTSKEVGQLGNHRIGRFSQKKIYMCKVCKFLFGKYNMGFSSINGYYLKRVNRTLEELKLPKMNKKDYGSLDINDISYRRHFYFKDISKRFYRI